jgi:hypothetical protein
MGSAGCRMLGAKGGSPFCFFFLQEKEVLSVTSPVNGLGGFSYSLRHW